MLSIYGTFVIITTITLCSVQSAVFPQILYDDEVALQDERMMSEDVDDVALQDERMMSQDDDVALQDERMMLEDEDDFINIMNNRDVMERVMMSEMERKLAAENKPMVCEYDKCIAGIGLLQEMDTTPEVRAQALTQVNWNTVCRNDKNYHNCLLGVATEDQCQDFRYSSKIRRTTFLLNKFCNGTNFQLFSTNYKCFTNLDFADGLGQCQDEYLSATFCDFDKFQTCVGSAMSTTCKEFKPFYLKFWQELNDIWYYCNTF